MHTMSRALTIAVLPLLFVSCASVPEEQEDRTGQVYDSPPQNLKSDIEAADYVRIRTGGISEGTNSETILEIKGQSDVSKFLAPLRLFENQRFAASCDCDGDPTVEIYQGGTLVTSIALKHGTALYWPENWPGEMLLDAEVFDEIAQTMAKNGFPQYRDEKDRMMALVQQLMAQ